MGIWITEAGQQHYLIFALDVDTTLRLYTNDVTAGLTRAQIHALDETDFSEATFTGYSAKALAAVSWGAATGVDPAISEFAEQTFTCTSGSQSLHGYYVTRDSDGALLHFEEFRGRPVLIAAGDDIRVTPRMSLTDNGGSAVTIGLISPWPTATAPSGHLLCDGSEVSRTLYAELFNVIGTTFGAGNGSTTFNLPDLKFQGGSENEHDNYTPTFTNFTANVEWATYYVSGGLCHYQGRVSLTSTVTGTPGISLPVALQAEYEDDFLIAPVIGGQDLSGSARYPGAFKFETTTRIDLRDLDTTAAWSATVPFTWASGDSISWDFTYPVDEQTGLDNFVIRAL